MKPSTLIKKAKGQKFVRTALPFKSIEKVLMIWDSNQSRTDVEELKTFGHELRKSGKSITFLTFHSLKKFPVDMQENDLYRLCCKGDFNLIAAPKSKKLKGILMQPFDLLINGCLSEHPYLKTIALYSKAKFRVGPYLSNDDTYFYELLIKPNGADPCENYLIEAGKYLNKIK